MSARATEKRIQLNYWRKKSRPTLGVNFGDFRRVTPISRAFGFERGLPVDRYYIERFLNQHAEEICGRVLEVGDNEYTLKFGGGRLSQSDIINISIENNPATTIVADLTRADQIPDNTFDCFIFTQTLQFIFDLQAAVHTIHRILKPQGVLLATFPVISQICRFDMDRWGDYWRFTNASIYRLLTEVFPPEAVDINAHGNVLAALCIMHGIATEDLTVEELDFHDPDYQILITARTVKP